MVCGGFHCSKNSLCALNLLYIMWFVGNAPSNFLQLQTRFHQCSSDSEFVDFQEMVSLLLIGIAAWGIGFGLISSFRVVGVAVGVGIFLFLIALVGLIGAIKHHQVLLFFYMIILFLVFILQFSVSCACLALNKEQQHNLLEVGWNHTETARKDVERNLDCCGYQTINPNDNCSASCYLNKDCRTCGPLLEEYAGEVLRYVGGIGFFFSFTEILGVWWTYRYRNQKDPRANPSAFL